MVVLTGVNWASIRWVIGVYLQVVAPAWNSNRYRDTVRSGAHVQLLNSLLGSIATVQ